jgi:hypothetical protein
MRTGKRPALSSNALAVSPPWLLATSIGYRPVPQPDQPASPLASSLASVPKRDARQDERLAGTELRLQATDLAMRASNPSRRAQRQVSGLVGPVTCPYPCPCRVCPCRGWACRGGLRRACQPRHDPGRLGRPTQPAGGRRKHSHPLSWSRGRLGAGCSTGRRLTPLHPHALPRNRPSGVGVLDHQGQGDAQGRPKQRPHDDQDLAETAKRSVHRPPRSNDPSTLPTPHARKLAQAISQLAAGQFYRARRTIWDRCRMRRNVRKAAVVA